MGRFHLQKVIATLAVLCGACLAIGQELEQPESRVELLDLDQVLGLDAPPLVEHEEVKDPLVFPAGAAEELPPLEVAEEEPPARPANELELVAPNQELADLTKTMPVRELVGKPVRRGPIHEAFADPIQQAPTADKVIRKAPPVQVDEIPPTIADDSRNMEWIPGYWAWDMQSKDYVWISGVWRKAPKNRIWVPGRWDQVKRGYQWVPGAWLPTIEEGVVVKKEVLPMPPKSLEKGPTSAAPSKEHFWVPGAWERTDAEEYAWRPGYWSRSQKNWVWVPDHYAWDPEGCVFVPGYWDYTWERRGTLYAPCTFENVTGVERISYRPTKVVDADQWLLNLWMGPRSSSYYFGDYYDCVNRGYTPWYKFYGRNRGSYDPLYSYYRWQFPTTYGIGLYGYLNGLHTHYGSHRALRPTVRICPYDQLGARGYGSLYGDVRGLSSLLHGYPSIRRFDYHDPYHRHYDHGGVGYRSRLQYGLDRQHDRYQHGIERDRLRRALDRSRITSTPSRSRVDRSRPQTTARPRVESMGPVRRSSSARPNSTGAARGSGGAARVGGAVRGGR